MGPAPETKIWLALKQTLSGSGVSPIAWPGDSFEPKTSGYYEPMIQFAPPVRQTIRGKKSRRTGLLILKYALGIGVSTDTVVIERVASILATYFYTDSMHQYLDVCVRVTDAPTVMRGYRDGGYWHVPSRIEWEAYA